jgi:hypothetical protein
MISPGLAVAAVVMSGSPPLSAHGGAPVIPVSPRNHTTRPRHVWVTPLVRPGQVIATLAHGGPVAAAPPVPSPFFTSQE